MTAHHLVWLRQDCRLSDNPALTAALEAGKTTVIYIHDDINAGEYIAGAASLVWTHHTLTALKKALQGNLSIYKGDAIQIIQDICQSHNITHIHWNRCYEPWRIQRDKHIKAQCETAGIDVQSYNASLLWEPWTIQKNDGTPYRVFTPFYRRGCLKSTPPRQPLASPSLKNLQATLPDSGTIDGLGLIPNEAWAVQLPQQWQITEQGAQAACEAFLNDGVKDYKNGRNFPAQNNTSRLSPYLHHGLISPHQVWHQVIATGDDNNIDHFCSELGWREFSYSQLFYNPTMTEDNIQKKFDRFPWIKDDIRLACWQRGKTGVPMVDAGMRELWQTGYMHNRVRMIVGSFLVKNCLLDWRLGAAWFWDCLFDADLASNTASWQWVAGCGADAAPYFRIFNPVTQGEKFDPSGEYIRRYIPEIAALPDKYLYAPWTAPEDVLVDAGVTLGETYPHPIVDLKQSREAALAALSTLKEATT